ncbi:MAG: hypothetical protein RBS40_04035 [Rhodocyclaceae bacterium]|jgi:hypothetical protein|nr:hypothetical protein [Rhodocyclaceae bacterium]
MKTDNPDAIRAMAGGIHPQSTLKLEHPILKRGQHNLAIKYLNARSKT